MVMAADRFLSHGSLARDSFMAAMSDGERRTLLARARPREFKSGQLIFAAGDDGDGLYVIESGDVAITLDDPDDRELIVNIFGAGDVFGEMAVLDARERSANAVAMGPVKAYFVSTENFQAFLAATPSLGPKIIKLLCERLRRTNRELADSVFFGLGPRLANRLLLIHDHYRRVDPTREVVEFQLSQARLARMLGCTRESINKLIAGWKKAGILAHENARITILDREKLEAISTSGG
jgi:CRP-like cAMP-binding protein